MRVCLGYCLLLCCLSSVGLAKPKCLPVILDTSVAEQRGPTCLIAAAVTGLAAQGHRLDSTLISRETAVFPDGVHPYDIAITLNQKGFSGLLFTGPPEAAARLVEAGFAPIMLLKSPTGRHAVAITGSQREAGENGCSNTLSKLRVSDSRDGRHRWVIASGLSAQQSRGQLLVFYAPESRAKLSAEGFPLKTAQAIDAQYRAEVLYRRALKHATPNTQQKVLLEDALNHNACHAQAYALLTTAYPAAAERYAARAHCPDTSSP